MARYRLLMIGVYDTLTSHRIIPQSGSLWDTYLAWRAAGNTPDPYVPPEPVAETLQQAKARKILSIKREGLARVRTRFEAVVSLDQFDIYRELLLSVIPSARALTTRVQWCNDTYQAGTDAVAEVHAATTIAQVDAVTPAWPAL